MKGRAADPAWHGGVTSERAECVLCPNPSPMTLDGTNTWLLAEPGSDEVVVVDPGPLDEGHLQRGPAPRRRVGSTRRPHPAHPRPRRPRRERRPLPRADRCAGAGLRPRPRRPAGRRDHHGRRSRDPRRRDAGSHERLLLLRAPRRQHAAHRRHGPRPRHDRRRLARRQPRVLPRLARPHRGPDPGRRRHEPAPGPRAVRRRRRRHRDLLPPAPRGTAGPGAGRGRPRCADGIRRRRAGLRRRAAERLAGGRAVGAGPAGVPPHARRERGPR